MLIAKNQFVCRCRSHESEQYRLVPKKHHCSSPSLLGVLGTSCSGASLRYDNRRSSLDTHLSRQK